MTEHAEPIEHTPWKPTAALLRSLLGGVAMTLAALAFGRPDLLVLGAPLVLVTVWSLVTRPREDPLPRSSLAHQAVREGEATTWHASLTCVPGMEQAVVALAAGSWTQTTPPTAMLARTILTESAEHEVSLDIAVQSRRWGRRPVGPGLVAATSAWGAFRFGPHECVPQPLLTLPLPATFDAKAPTPQPRGLVGLSRSRRAGDGGEFASIRAFAPGDRLRRIHWPLSLREGQLYVTSTWADQDSHVMLMVDALDDVGESDGLGREASSLDVTVRAAAAMAEHYLRSGDRVGLRVFGARGAARLPAMAGRSHLRRVLDTLAGIGVGTDRRTSFTKIAGGLPAGTLVIILSALVSPDALTTAVTLARRGLSVIVIDTLPQQGDHHGDPHVRLARRIRALERDREIRQVQEIGIPTVPWRGPGSLDQVLRDLGRRSLAPRMARR
jgi:uncharacterized protein (DUF58 family)